MNSVYKILTNYNTCSTQNLSSKSHLKALNYDNLNFNYRCFNYIIIWIIILIQMLEKNNDKSEGWSEKLISRLHQKQPVWMTSWHAVLQRPVTELISQLFSSSIIVGCFSLTVNEELLNIICKIILIMIDYAVDALNAVITTASYQHWASFIICSALI